MNKRYNNNNSNNRFSKAHNNPYNILPPYDVLEGYEETSPGSVDKIVDMAKKEQSHRHKWQEEHLTVHGRIHKWGQIFAFTYNIAILFLVAYLVDGGSKELAVKLFIINAVLMAFALLVTFIERRIMNRRPPRRFSGRKNNNNHNKDKKEKK